MNASLSESLTDYRFHKKRGTAIPLAFIVVLLWISPMKVKMTWRQGAGTLP